MSTFNINIFGNSNISNNQQEIKDMIEEISKITSKINVNESVPREDNNNEQSEDVIVGDPIIINESTTNVGETCDIREVCNEETCNRDRSTPNIVRETSDVNNNNVLTSDVNNNNNVEEKTSIDSKEEEISNNNNVSSIGNDEGELVGIIFRGDTIIEEVRRPYDYIENCLTIGTKRCNQPSFGNDSYRRCNLNVFGNTGMCIAHHSRHQLKFKK